MDTNGFLKRFNTAVRPCDHFFYTTREINSVVACKLKNHIPYLMTCPLYNGTYILKVESEGIRVLTDKENGYEIYIFLSKFDAKVILGSSDNKKLYELPYRNLITSGPFLADWVSRHQDIDVITQINHDVNKKEKTFLSFNRVVRPHRVFLILELYKRKLIDDNFVSYSKYASHTGKDTDLFNDKMGMIPTHLIDEYKAINDSIPDIRYVDKIDFSENQAETPFPLDTYEKSIFSLVSETYMQENEIFLSEKIFKPIACKHPFIVLGPKGILKKLKQYGFKTYSKWFNEDYDNIEDPVERFYAVIDEVERICKLPWEEQLKIVEESRQIAEHNLSVLMDIGFVFKNTENLGNIKDIMALPYYAMNVLSSNTFINNCDDNAIVLHGPTHTHEEIIATINDNKNKYVIIDYTYEYPDFGLISKLKQLPDLSNTVLMALPHSVDGSLSDDEQECVNKGLCIDYNDWFVKNYQKYVPVTTDNFNNVKEKIFTLMTGKSRIHRTAVIGLLAEKDLLKYGHVSYFGDSIDDLFDKAKVNDFFESDAPDHIKEKVRAGLEKIKLPLTLDTENFDFSVSSASSYVSDYYKKSKFAVELETNFPDGDCLRATITEKSIKPLMTDTKYMVLGAKNQTKLLIDSLKFQNYQFMFNGKIDELINWVPWQEYDNISNRWERLEKFVEILESEILKHIDKGEHNE